MWNPALTADGHCLWETGLRADQAWLCFWIGWGMHVPPTICPQKIAEGAMFQLPDFVHHPSAHEPSVKVAGCKVRLVEAPVSANS